MEVGLQEEAEEDIAVVEDIVVEAEEDIMLLVERTAVEEEVMDQEEMDGCGQNHLNQVGKMG